MSYTSSYPSSSSFSSKSDDSSIVEIRNILKCRQDYKNTKKKINKLILKGKKEKNKIKEEKKNSNEKSFIGKKKIEKKNKKLIKNYKENKETDKQVNEKENTQIKCLECQKIIKKKNYYYHDAILHDGLNISLKDKKRALNFYISKKLKKVNTIYSDIMLKAKKLNIHTIDDPELIHIQKIGFHIMRFYEKRKNK